MRGLGTGVQSRTSPAVALPMCVADCCILALLLLQVDAIFKAAALAANSARIPLAKMAVAETRMGCVEDKVGDTL